MANLVQYKGSREGAYDLVSELRKAGLDVQWTPPDRERGAMLQEIAVGIIAGGSVDLIHSVIANYLGRHKKTEIRIVITEKEQSDPNSRDSRARKPGSQ